MAARPFTANAAMRGGSPKLCAKLVRQCRDHHRVRAVSAAAPSAVLHDTGVWIRGAPDPTPGLGVPPTVEDDAVGGRYRPGRNGRVTGAGERSEIRVCRLIEDGAVVDQSPEARGPLVVELVQIVGPHLVHGQNDDEPGPILPGRTWR